MPLRRPLLLAFSAALAVAAPAVAADTVKVSFTPKKASASTALKISGQFDGTRIIDQLVVQLPAGTKLDTSAAPRCPEATEAQLAAAKGGYGELCPANTKVGTGTGEALLGDATTATKFALDFYNEREGLVVDLKVGGAVAFTSFFDPRSGGKLEFGLRQTPSLKAKITKFAISLQRKGAGGKALIRTPKVCPSTGRLPASVTTRAAGKKQTIRTTIACAR